MGIGRDPFGLESPAQRLFREERERRRLFDDLGAHRGGIEREIERVKDELLGTRRFTSPFGGQTFRTVREEIERNRAYTRAIDDLISPASVIARQQTAMAIAARVPLLRKEAEALASTLGSAFNSTTRALEAQSQAIAALLGTSDWQRERASLSAAAEAMRPSMAAIARSAALRRATDAATLRLSAGKGEAEDPHLAAFAEESAVASAVLSSLAEADDPQESIRHLAEFLKVLTRIFDRLGKNTVREITEAGLVTLFVMAVTLLDAFGPKEPAELGQGDKAALADIRGEVETLRERLSAYERVLESADREFTEDLPRATARTQAKVRFLPDGSSPLVYRLKNGEVVAVASRKGRWRQVIFRDSLTDQLSRGWVYASSLSESAVRP
ncbi:MAG: hypothetical protein JOZ90_04485 [Alphaproteobacteria bacterium]|nr:hypothetical protein [Alphaproteobacteria bacterium]